MQTLNSHLYPGILKNVSNKTAIDFIKKIRVYIENQYNLKEGSLYQRTNKTVITTPRFVVFFLVRKLKPEISLRLIADHFGYKDHSPVQHGISRVREWKNIYPEFGATVERFINNVDL